MSDPAKEEPAQRDKRKYLKGEGVILENKGKKSGDHPVAWSLGKKD